MTPLRELLARTAAPRPAGDAGSPVISSRVRLARNLADHVFPGWADEAECERIWRELEPRLAGLPSLAGPLTVANADLTPLEREMLVERHWVSREHAARTRGSGLAIAPDASRVILVNEEDHLRMQALAPGLALHDCWRAVDAADSELERRVTYAFSSRLGYLTACPTNVGTGMRASALLHLPGLVLMEDMEAVLKGVQKLGLAVRGLWGEGTEAVGHLFQISNQMTLGESEEQIVEGLEQIVREILEHERHARARLRATREAVLRDYAGRAWGLLTQAYLLSSNEALAQLSALRLGVDAGIVDQVDCRLLDELMLLAQPAHLQNLAGRALKPAERDQARARLIRERLGKNPGRPARRRPRKTDHE